MGGCGAARFVAKDAAGGLKHGDGLLAVEAVVNSPVGLTLDTQGYLYICERGENKIRRAQVMVVAFDGFIVPRLWNVCMSSHG